MTETNEGSKWKFESMGFRCVSVEIDRGSRRCYFPYLSSLLR